MQNSRAKGYIDRFILHLVFPTRLILSTISACMLYVLGSPRPYRERYLQQSFSCCNRLKREAHIASKGMSDFSIHWTTVAPALLCRYQYLCCSSYEGVIRSTNRVYRRRSCVKGLCDVLYVVHLKSETVYVATSTDPDISNVTEIRAKSN
jgi:hypothetical protein